MLSIVSMLRPAPYPMCGILHARGLWVTEAGRGRSTFGRFCVVVDCVWGDQIVSPVRRAWPEGPAPGTPGIAVWPVLILPPGTSGRARRLGRRINPAAEAVAGLAAFGRPLVGVGLAITRRSMDVVATYVAAI